MSVIPYVALLGFRIMPQNFTQTFQPCNKYAYALVFASKAEKNMENRGFCLGWTIQCLMYPMGRFWSICLNEPFSISCWNLLEKMRILKYGVGAIWTNHIFLPDPLVGFHVYSKGSTYTNWQQFGENKSDASSECVHNGVPMFGFQTEFHLCRR